MHARSDERRAAPPPAAARATAADPRPRRGARRPITVDQIVDDRAGVIAAAEGYEALTMRRARRPSWTPGRPRSTPTWSTRPTSTSCCIGRLCARARLPEPDPRRPGGTRSATSARSCATSTCATPASPARRSPWRRPTSRRCASARGCSRSCSPAASNRRRRPGPSTPSLLYVAAYCLEIDRAQRSTRHDAGLGPRPRRAARRLDRPARRDVPPHASTPRRSPQARATTGSTSPSA